MKKKFILAVLALIVALGAFFWFQKKPFKSGMQRTLSLIKPDAVVANHSGLIISQIEASGLKVIGLRMTRLSQAQAEQFYAVHKDRAFYPTLVDYMSSGPIVAIVLEGSDAVSTYRTLMGATNPENADEGTLRKQFGTNIEKNAVHGSDSVDNARKEIAFFFTDKEIYPR